ncbi:hypothetical protein CA236_15840 [Sphingomonas sp. ABOLG]|uniref:SRPBCC family protein n=1 Tax=Sphingomonas sp. ABOLG TaxID=1985880 RepID=UPI000F7EC1FA|nr:SRPBCC family protein [Sphingomonas sp. ABOLG]RSV14823.1 hypothetical protein CA236_15840 [Sphingomonas sp. ABOLG]
MPTFDNVTILRASPLRVWSGLTDFAGHSQWKPFVQLSGAAVCGGEATYTFRVDSLDKSMTAKADITCVHKPLVFAWSTGIAKLLLFEEAYALESEPTGMRLRHSLRFSGILAGPLAALMRRKLQGSLVRSDPCLERHLRRLSAQPAAKGRTLPPRHGFRNNRRPS